MAERPPPSTHVPSIGLALATYQCVLRLYPAAFRQRFGAEMVQVFRDGCRAAYREHGRWGVWALWLLIVPDIIVTATKERTAAAKEFTVQRTTLVRLGGLMAFVVIATSLANLTVNLLTNGHRISGASFGLQVAWQVATLLVYVGLYAVQRSLWGQVFWGITSVVFVLASSASAVALASPDLIKLTSVPLYNWLGGLLGLIIFLSTIGGSIVTLRSRVLGRWSIMPLLIQIWSFVGAILSVLAINAILSGTASGDRLAILILLSKIPLLIPTWGFTAGMGIGLLRAGNAVRPSPGRYPLGAV